MHQMRTRGSPPPAFAGLGLTPLPLIHLSSPAIQSAARPSTPPGPPAHPRLALPCPAPTHLQGAGPAGRRSRARAPSFLPPPRALCWPPARGWRSRRPPAPPPAGATPAPQTACPAWPAARCGRWPCSRHAGAPCRLQAGRHVKAAASERQASRYRCGGQASSSQMSPSQLHPTPPHPTSLHRTQPSAPTPPHPHPTPHRGAR